MKIHPSRTEIDIKSKCKRTVIIAKIGEIPRWHIEGGTRKCAS
jgi:hypothetical protein